MSELIMTLNGGSSSIKFAVFDDATPALHNGNQVVLSGEVQRIGLPAANLTLRDNVEGVTDRVSLQAPDHSTAIVELLPHVLKRLGARRIKAIGHRIVHGGPDYFESQLVTPALIDGLTRLISWDPSHLPGEIALLNACARQFPGRPQIACFDTAFHHDLPPHTRQIPLPRSLSAAGVRRYGFHGLSFAYLMQELAEFGGTSAAKGRVILAHLGSGASLAAVRGGRCLDTSMCFTPAAGLIMGTRSGDLDPGVITYLMRRFSWTPDQVDEMVNKKSGLLGISETSSDIRDLLTAETEDHRAAEAVTMFCYQVKKWIGAYAAALGGIDTLVFSGGIGQNSPEIRSRICEGLEFLEIRLDPAKNELNAAISSPHEAKVTVRVIKTNEELMIVRQVKQLLATIKE